MTAVGHSSSGCSSAWFGVQSARTPYLLHIWGASEAWEAQHNNNKSSGLFQASLGNPCYPEGCSSV